MYNNSQLQHNTAHIPLPLQQTYTITTAAPKAITIPNTPPPIRIALPSNAMVLVVAVVVKSLALTLAAALPEGAATRRYDAPEL